MARRSKVTTASAATSVSTNAPASGGANGELKAPVARRKRARGARNRKNRGAGAGGARKAADSSSDSSSSDGDDEGTGAKKSGSDSDSDDSSSEDEQPIASTSTAPSGGAAKLSGHANAPSAVATVNKKGKSKQKDDEDDSDSPSSSGSSSSSFLTTSSDEEMPTSRRRGGKKGQLQQQQQPQSATSGQMDEEFVTHHTHSNDFNHPFQNASMETPAPTASRFTRPASPPLIQFGADPDIAHNIRAFGKPILWGLLPGDKDMEAARGAGAENEGVIQAELAAAEERYTTFRNHYVERMISRFGGSLDTVRQKEGDTMTESRLRVLIESIAGGADAFTSRDGRGIWKTNNGQDGERETALQGLEVTQGSKTGLAGHEQDVDMQ